MALTLSTPHVTMKHQSASSTTPSPDTVNVRFSLNGRGYGATSRHIGLQWKANWKSCVAYRMVRLSEAEGHFCYLNLCNIHITQEI